MTANAHEPANATAPASEPELTDAVPTPEHGGPAGLEPTRYGDWEKKGRCIDF